MTASNQEQSINIVNAEANQINRNGLLLVLATAPVVWQKCGLTEQFNVMREGGREIEDHNDINRNICKPIYEERGKSKSKLEITHTEKKFVS